mgnify:CR=1 FL=1
MKELVASLENLQNKAGGLLQEKGHLCSKSETKQVRDYIQKVDEVL